MFTAFVWVVAVVRAGACRRRSCHSRRRRGVVAAGCVLCAAGRTWVWGIAAGCGGRGWVPGLQEAYEVIKGMSVKVTEKAWEGLLGACKNFEELRLAKVASRALVEVESGNAANYVL